MNRDPLDRPGRADRVEQQLILRPRVAIWVLGRPLARIRPGCR